MRKEEDIDSSTQIVGTDHGGRESAGWLESFAIQHIVQGKKKKRDQKRTKKGQKKEEEEEENLLTSVQVNVAKISTRSEPAACGITIEASSLLLADSNSSRLPGTLRVLSSGTNACSSSYRFDKERSRAKD